MPTCGKPSKPPLLLTPVGVRSPPPFLWTTANEVQGCSSSPATPVFEHLFDSNHSEPPQQGHTSTSPGRCPEAPRSGRSRLAGQRHLDGRVVVAVMQLQLLSSR